MVVRISVCRTREAWKQLFVLLLSAQTALLGEGLLGVSYFRTEFALLFGTGLVAED